MGWGLALRLRVVLDNDTTRLSPLPKRCKGSEYF